MDIYATCADYDDFQNYIKLFPATAFPPLLKDQAYEISVSHGEVIISVETTTRVDQVTKPLRTKTIHNSPTAISFVTDYLRFVLVKFVPVAISNFCMTAFKYKVRAEDLNDQDIRFQDYFLLNNELQLLKKSRFLELCTPLDFLYATTFNPNGLFPTFTPSALLTMYATSSASIIGAQSDSILGQEDFVGGSVLDVTRGAVTKRIITTKGVFVKLFTSYSVRVQENDILSSLLSLASESAPIPKPQRESVHIPKTIPRAPSTVEVQNFFDDGSL